jgi:transcriptional regulator with XRE-family HTH domain
MELRISQIRKAKDITQKTLAELVGTTQQQIAKIESGTVDPQLSTLKRISEALQCEITELFYTKAEFLREIRAVIKRKGVNLKRTSLIELNTICYMEDRIPTFHPFWEKIVIKNNNIEFKE